MLGRTEGRSSLLALLEPAATILLIVVVLGVGGFTIWDRLHPQTRPAFAPPPDLPQEPVSIEGAPTRGDRSAKIALILFSEFECPFCAKAAHEVLPEIDRQYLETGKVLLVWRHFPLAFHQHAARVAEASECAQRQGRFWDFHDWAFLNQENLGEADMREVAKGLHLDTTAFASCLEAGVDTRLKADVELGNSIGVNGTPAWFVGRFDTAGKVNVTDRLSGARPFAEFQKVIDKALISAASGVAAARPRTN